MARKDEFLKGYLCAVSALIEKNEGVDTNTRELFREGVSNGTNLQKLAEIGVDLIDLERFEKYWDELS